MQTAQGSCGTSVRKYVAYVRVLIKSGTAMCRSSQTCESDATCQTLVTCCAPPWLSLLTVAILNRVMNQLFMRPIISVVRSSTAYSSGANKHWHVHVKLNPCCLFSVRMCHLHKVWHVHKRSCPELLTTRLRTQPLQLSGCLGEGHLHGSSASSHSQERS